MLQLLLFFAASSSALVCPPFCTGGSNRSSVFLASFQQLVFVGKVIAAAQTVGLKRVTGVGAEVDHVVEVMQVFKGGIFLKRIGKNVVHVFSGLGAEPGSECSVSMENGKVYLFGGSSRSGTSSSQTARIDVNQCSLLVLRDNVAQDEAAWLSQVLQAKDQHRCPVNLTLASVSPACSCNGSQFACVTNLFQPSLYCGPPRSWCIPTADIAP
jgi:hypothetical protein